MISKDCASKRQDIRIKQQWHAKRMLPIYYFTVAVATPLSFLICILAKCSDWSPTHLYHRRLSWFHSALNEQKLTKLCSAVTLRIYLCSQDLAPTSHDKSPLSWWAWLISRMARDDETPHRHAEPVVIFLLIRQPPLQRDPDPRLNIVPCCVML